MSLSERDKEKFSKLLQTEKEKILNEKSKELLEEGKGDASDQTQALRENDLAAQWSTRKSQTLNRINLALEKIQNDEFGYCEECGNQIERKRLAARPFTENCIECREALEKEQISRMAQASPSWTQASSGF